MIVIKLMGGLGNQMFQYALGRRLAIERGVPLKLDLSLSTQKSNRQYRLDKFKISAEIATPYEIRYFTKSHWPPAIRKIFGRVQTEYPKWMGQVVIYEGLRYCPEVLEVAKHAYLKGYWQSEKYFITIRPTLLGDLQIKEALDGVNKQIIDEIRSTQSVGIHIRHGDYVSDPRMTQMHGVLPLKYYKRAMQIVEESVEAPHYYIFSDDIPWARQNLGSVKNITLVDNNDSEHEYIDFSLLCACKHHIIANSSFSWWAAWLNEKPHKITIAPKRWFWDETIDSRDLLPAEWTAI